MSVGIASEREELRRRKNDKKRENVRTTTKEQDTIVCVGVSYGQYVQCEAMDGECRGGGRGELPREREVRQGGERSQANPLTSEGVKGECGVRRT